MSICNDCHCETKTSKATHEATRKELAEAVVVLAKTRKLFEEEDLTIGYPFAGVYTQICDVLTKEQTE